MCNSNRHGSCHARWFSLRKFLFVHVFLLADVWIFGFESGQQTDSNMLTSPSSSQLCLGSGLLWCEEATCSPFRNVSKLHLFYQRCAANFFFKKRGRGVRPEGPKRKGCGKEASDDRLALLWWNIDAADFDSAIGTFDPDLWWQKRPSPRPHPPASSSSVSPVRLLSKKCHPACASFDQSCTLWRRTYRDRWRAHTGRDPTCCCTELAERQRRGLAVVIYLDRRALIDD